MVSVEELVLRTAVAEWKCRDVIVARKSSVRQIWKILNYVFYAFYKDRTLPYEGILMET